MTFEEKNHLLDRLNAVLSEHCEGWAVAVEIKEEGDDPSTMHAWGGGFNRALGLAHRMVRRMEDADGQTNTQPPPDGEEWKMA